MALEIERKFLLANDAWKREVIKSERMRDGLIARNAVYSSGHAPRVLDP